MATTGRNDALIRRLRYAVVLTDHKTMRFIAALQDSWDYTVVFLRE
jgi:hypothetical protein